MPYYNMYTSTPSNLQKLSRYHELEVHPLSNIAIASLNKILQDVTLSREEKLRTIVEFNLPFSIVHHSLLTSRNEGQIQEMDYAFFWLHLINWYKVNYVEA